MLRKQELQNRGFTVIEFLITMAIFAIAGSVIVAILVSQNSNFYEQSARNKLSADMLSIFRPIESHVQQASSLAASASIGAETFTTDSDTAVFSIPSIDASGNNIASKYDTVILHTDGSDLRLLVSPDPQSVRISEDRILSKIVSEVVFRYDNEIMSAVSTFSITIKLENKINGTRAAEYVQTATYSLRNWFT